MQSIALRTASGAKNRRSQCQRPPRKGSPAALGASPCPQCAALREWGEAAQPHRGVSHHYMRMACAGSSAAARRAGATAASTPQTDAISATCNATLGELTAHAMAHGFAPMAEDGLRRVLEGITTVEEVGRVVDLTTKL